MKWIAIFLPTLLTVGFFLEGAPRRYEDDLWIQLKEMRDSIDDLRREVNNHESEIRTYELRTTTQEDLVDSLRKDIKESHQSQKDHLKNNQGSLEMKLNQLETSQKGLIADLKQIKGHSQDTQELLKVYRDKITFLEKTADTLARNMDILQSAMNSLIEAMKGGSATSVSSVDGGVKTYRVKAGDSLEKIARTHGTTLRALKEINGLTKDQIGIGQLLKLPE